MSLVATRYHVPLLSHPLEIDSIQAYPHQVFSVSPSGDQAVHPIDFESNLSRCNFIQKFFNVNCATMNSTNSWLYFFVTLISNHTFILISENSTACGRCRFYNPRDRGKLEINFFCFIFLFYVYIKHGFVPSNPLKR